MKIKFFADQAVFVSSITEDTFNKVLKYAPETFVLKDEDGKGMFKIAMGTKAEVSVYGIQFNGFARDSKKMTAVLPVAVPDGTDVKKFLADEFGVTVNLASKIEAQVAAKLNELNGIVTNVANSVEVISLDDATVEADAETPTRR